MGAEGGIQQRLSQGGALRRYRSAVVGDQGVTDFLFYEFSVVVLSPISGIFGVYARRLFLPLLVKNSGHNITIHQNVTFRRPHRIRIGNNVTLENGVTFDVKTNKGKIVIGNDVHIGKGTILSCPGGTLIVESGTRIGSQCRLGSLVGLSIGKQSVIDDSVCIVGAGHAYSSVDVPIIQQPLTCKGPTVIEEFVTLGQEVTVLDGVHVGHHATVCARSLVNREIDAHATVKGVPAGPC